MREITKTEEYLGYAMTNVSKKDANEILLLSRRIQYITIINSDDCYTDDLVVKLCDVNSSEKTLKQLTSIYKE